MKLGTQLTLLDRMKAKPVRAVEIRTDPPPPAAYNDTESESIRATCWREGRDTIRFLTGMPHARAGASLGGMLKIAGDDCALVLAVLRAARDTRPAEPMAWIMKAVRSRAQDRAALCRMGIEWDLIPAADLDANAARLMAQEDAAAQQAPHLEYEGMAAHGR